MESLPIALNNKKFDAAVHGDGTMPSLSESGDLAIYIKTRATVSGKAMAVVTFTVKLPDGSMARAQATTTVALLDCALSCLRGWKDGGHLDEPSARDN